MEFLEDLQAKLAEDGFNFKPIIDEHWHKIKQPIRGSYATRRFPNGVIMTVTSWDGDYKKVYKCFTNNHINGESGEIDTFVTEQIEKAQAIKKEANEKAAIEAKKIWDEESLEGANKFISPYLQRKGLDSEQYGARLDSRTGAQLLVPVVDDAGKLWGIQRISPSGDKTFIKGQRKEACFHQIGNVGKTIYIAEGFATGASLNLCTGDCTVVAFDAGNLKRVAKIFREKYPQAQIIIAGDNDELLTGQKAAESAAKEVGGHAFYPATVGKDWNDCLVEGGKEFLTKQINLFLSKIPQEIPKKSKNTLQFKSITQIMESSQVKPSWVVENFFAQGSISAIYGKPKAGKSTLARQLAHHVATGQLFLGQKVTKGPVLYVGMEEKAHKLARHFTLMQTPNDAPLFSHCATVPLDFFKEVAQAIELHKPVLVVLDTLGKCIQVKEDKYENWIRELTPYSNLAWEQQTHIMFIHHAKKGEVNEDSALGSQAIRACMDVNLWLTRDDKDPNKRIMWGESRDWEDIEKQYLLAKKETQTFLPAGTITETRADENIYTLKDFLKENGPASKKDIQSVLKMNWTQTAKLIDNAVYKTAIFRRVGAGSRGSDLFENNPQFIDESADF